MTFGDKLWSLERVYFIKSVMESFSSSFNNIYLTDCSSNVKYCKDFFPLWFSVHVWMEFMQLSESLLWPQEYSTNRELLTIYEWPMLFTSPSFCTPSISGMPFAHVIYLVFVHSFWSKCQLLFHSCTPVMFTDSHYVLSTFLGLWKWQWKTSPQPHEVYCLWKRQ